MSLISTSLDDGALVRREGRSLQSQHASGVDLTSSDAGVAEASVEVTVSLNAAFPWNCCSLKSFYVGCRMAGSPL